MLASREPPAARVPADHGLASLGLVMQLAGRVTAALTALAGALALLGPPIGSPPRAAWFWFAIALGVARSQLHHAAGRALTYSRPAADPFAAMRRYAGFGVGHAIVLGLVAARVGHAPAAAAAGIAGALALWPVVLAVVSALPRLGALRAGIPLAEDRGLEAAAILMTVLGVWGALSAAAILRLLGGLSPHHVRHGWSVMLVVVFALLVVRSSLHVRAGLAGLRDASFDRPSELAARYAAFGVVSAFCVGGVLALLAMSERLTPDAIAGVAVVCWLLVTWPMIIKRYFSQRQFAELFAGDRAPHRRAPDAGLTGLGWLLAGHATAVAALLLVAAAVRAPVPHAGAARALLHLVIGHGTTAAALVVLEGAAAIALISMSDRRRSIAVLYAGCAALAVVVPVVPELRALVRHPAAWRALALLPAAIQLVLPAVTFLLVRRATVPLARARYRTGAVRPLAVG